MYTAVRCIWPFLMVCCVHGVQVYALLHRQEVFAPFRSQQRFADLMENIFLVLDHFNAKVGAGFSLGASS